MLSDLKHNNDGLARAGMIHIGWCWWLEKLSKYSDSYYDGSDQLQRNYTPAQLRSLKVKSEEMLWWFFTLVGPQSSYPLPSTRCFQCSDFPSDPEDRDEPMGPCPGRTVVTTRVFTFTTFFVLHVKLYVGIYIMVKWTPRNVNLSRSPPLFCARRLKLLPDWGEVGQKVLI